MPKSDEPHADLAAKVTAIAASGYADPSAYEAALHALVGLATKNGVQLVRAA
jgi:hypothetical protein